MYRKDNDNLDALRKEPNNNKLQTIINTAERQDNWLNIR